MITLTLPLPPSSNRSTRNVPKVGRVKTKVYRDWLKQADAAFLRQKRGLTPLTGTCIVEIFVPPNMRGDTSNRIKLVEDFLVRVKLTPDDKHNHKVSAERWHMVEEGQCIVVVKPHVVDTTDQITQENLHPETDVGPPVGAEQL